MDCGTGYWVDTWLVESALLINTVIDVCHVIDIPSCEDLIQRIERDAEETLKKATSLIIGNSGSTSATAPSPGTVGKNMNNPGAEIWGVGKSKL